MAKDAPTAVSAMEHFTTTRPESSYTSTMEGSKMNNDKPLTADQNELTNANDGSAAAKRRKSSNNSTMDSDHILKEKLAAIWANVMDDNSESKAVAETVEVFSGQVESLIKAGLDAYQRWENANRECKILKEEIAAKNLEIDRLRAIEESNRTSMQNLLQAAEVVKTEARDVSRGALMAASLRAELNTISSKLDEALHQTEEIKRKNILLEEENLHIKTKLSRVVQEKIKLERDQRMSMSLSKHFDNSSATDWEYYKHQVNELSGQLQVCL
ncbi:hypothetical protein MPSEU_001059100 [Mayamaea pseudoterrestris]|nr:hypothetical protein MPSEU_001059100 [Mayamaea pseudoterrestris]